MTGLSNNNENILNKSINLNYSDDELNLNDLHMKCNFLQSEILKMLKDKQNLLIAIKHNEDTKNSLNELKRELEFYKSHLCKKKFKLKMSADLREITQSRKLSELNKQSLMLEEYYKQAPFKTQLESLVKENKHLEDELKNTTELIELTKKELKEFRNSLKEDFQRKVCELAELMVKTIKYI